MQRSPLFTQAERGGKDKDKLALYPVVKCRNSFEDIVSIADQDLLYRQGVKACEQYHADAFRRYAEGNGMRRANLDTLTRIMQKTGVRTRGMQVDDGGSTTGGILDKSARSLLNHEQTIKRVLEVLDLEDARMADSQKRRRTEKGPEWVRREVEYRTAEYGGKLTVAGVGAQGLPRKALLHLVPDTIDFDICNAVFTTVSQMIERLDPAHLSDFSEEVALIRSLAQSRETVIESQLRTDHPSGKRLLLSVLGGMSVPEAYEGNATVEKLRRASRFLRWLACTCLPNTYNTLSRDDSRWSAASTCSSWWQIAECHILHNWLTWIRTRGEPSHISLHHDGVRVDRKFVETQRGCADQFCRDSVDSIATATGFRVAMKVKVHACFLHLCRDKGVREANTLLPSGAFLTTGNCIPLALYRLQSLLPGSNATGWDDVVLRDPDVARRGGRSYVSCFACAGVSWQSHFGFAPASDGAYIVHSEVDGCPHATAVVVTSETAKLHDGEELITLSIADMRRCILDAVDERLIVTFHLGAANIPPRSIYSASEKMTGLERLSDLMAGAGASKAPPKHLDPLPPGVRANVIGPLLARLQDEVCRYETILTLELSETKTVNVRRLGGDRRCELCPLFAASGPKMLRHHVANAHVISSHYCPAGRKTLSIVYALHDADCAAGTRGGDYLRRAALAVRQSLLPGPSSLRLDIDRCMVLLLQSSGPTYVSSDVVVLRRDLRRVGYVYYDKGMAETLLREALLSRGRVRTLLPRIMLSATLQGSELVNL